MSNPLIPKSSANSAEILDKSNLTELEYEDEGCRICLTRELPHSAPLPPVHPAPVPPAFAPAPVMPQPAAPAAPAPAAPVSEEDYAKLPGAVKSPMVGVVYLSSDPNSPDYVKVGDTVSAGDTVCLIEAMKTFNPVKAHMAGKVTKILVSGGDPVEYGEPLIIIE
ncbi:MAG: acetyl-CoA carboxylase biotin carboxyl carrier protein [Alphaproteobacteria bacterium]